VERTYSKVSFKKEISSVTCTVAQPVWTNQTKVVTYLAKVPYEAVRDVTCCRPVPVNCTDPCTGCTYTACKMETFVQQVKYTAWRCVPAQKEVVVRVCSYVPKQVTYQCKKMVPVVKEEKAKVMERFCTWEEYHQVIKVPVCVPCAPAAQTCCY